ncbi:hypothetical protein Back11_32140 [Paenibacillus baekrokdamisoli]|uniref:Uncharacterized protein n=1 Tax=Paenibacillus baekrokdamisoli TaxID=1712516 RepID=A0A3G9JFW4_9BACL|nr:hypothetical protein [Paenibacillus baekrokdamisoli]MBB3071621.1 hypothetical protein [Paenibacillus baekrokdamisoli]BBH21869.1 hypothetical protein Back11_32140 [Paenibacillus baekrokdamisoli]
MFSLVGCFNIIEDYRDTTDDVIVLPNDYRLFKGNSELHYIAKKQDHSPIVAESNVYMIGWNDRYVLYKRKITDDLELGILDTKNGKVTKLSLDKNVSDQLNELGIENIELKNVNTLFDEKAKKLDNS